MGQADSTSPTPSPSVSASGKHIVYGTGHLHLTITPKAGPVGTKVRIEATGCGDPNGQNHAVSFNAGFGNTLQSAKAHYKAVDIPSRLVRETLTADYRITADDARAAKIGDAPPPRFFVQCATDVADSPFRIVT